MTLKWWINNLVHLSKTVELNNIRTELQCMQIKKNYLGVWGIPGKNPNYGNRIYITGVFKKISLNRMEGFSGGSDGKESSHSAGDLGSILGMGRSLGGGNGNPLQYSCPENPKDRGDRRVTVHGIAESEVT